MIIDSNENASYPRRFSRHRRKLENSLNNPVGFSRSDDRVRVSVEESCEPIGRRFGTFRRGSKKIIPVAAYLLLVLLLAGGASSCSLETAATRSSTGNEFSSNRVDNQVSNVGALKAYADSLNRVSIIRPGDQIQITVWGYPRFNTTTTVNEYGTISIPLVGEIIAAGLTEAQLSEQLKQRLSEYVKGTVRLTISHIGMEQRVSVMGAVSRQGNYPALTDLSLVEVLAEAGGTTTTADLKHIKIFRGGASSNVVEINLTEYLNSGNVRYIPRVGPGDMVYVPEQQDLVRDFSVYAGEVVLLFGFFTLLR